MSSTKDLATAPSWKHPDELIQLQRLRQRKKQLAARLSKSSNQNQPDLSGVDKASLLEAKIAQKRKNPFAKPETNKKVRTEETVIEDDSLLSFIEAVPSKDTLVRCTPPSLPRPPVFSVKPFDATAFTQLLKAEHTNLAFGGPASAAAGAAQEDETPLEPQKLTKHLPMDWSIKTRVRFFSRNELPATTLKTSQLASGLTSFVRCMDTQQSSACSSLDISPATRFSQATYYWQHPHLPWLTLFPRTAKENSGMPPLGERERRALAEDWDVSFRGLFQLLRARQCPYFYLCANSFTVLFRAAGTGGIVETHALMSPTTRGMRSALRQEGIEFTMPLKKETVAAAATTAAPAAAVSSGLNKSADSAFSEESNSVGLVDAGLKEEFAEEEPNVEQAEGEEEEEEAWLESLGVDGKEIRRMQMTHTRKQKAQEMAEDYSDNSLLLIEGVECQGFFSFLLNAKSTVTNVGRLAGVPPTLLAPVAFPRATMQQLSTRSSKVRMDGVDYHSVEAKGVVLPTFLPHITRLLGETRDVFSATLVSHNTTLAFSKATMRLLDQPPRPGDGEAAANGGVEAANDKQADEDVAGQVVFGQENLSDCGLLPAVIEDMCRTGPLAVGLLERVCHDRACGYAWS